jgi:hypothetical protein
MVTVITTNGIKLDGYSYYYGWRQVRWLVITMNDTSLGNYSIPMSTSS